MNGQAYVCEKCGEDFISIRPHEEAEAESKALFGDIPGEDKAIICDPCFTALMSWMKNEGMV